ncbi:transcriptional regulator [Nocardia sp. CDC159]|uniref:Transcriptional regulator n=1 Tax=Nocardia pulmonis TaxID=2951408 RepID=A0A9X2EEP5_9NOCA|nr:MULTISPECIES: transcriptional regulator [Nocardia]MCM6778065.1 transcriptional regulator [Nocardia pulmonis]MCM6790954.1 transcriptional regulator [Nocardia sp. CDC159]
MSRAAEPTEGDSFAARLNRLIAEHEARTGVTMSLSHFIRDFERTTGVPLSKGYLSQLRNNLAPEPRLDLVRAFARYFEVPPSYFLDDERPDDAQGELAEAMRRAGVGALGLRAAGLSETSLRHIAQIIDNIRALEGLPPVDDPGPDSPATPPRAAPGDASGDSSARP